MFVVHGQRSDRDDIVFWAGVRAGRIAVLTCAQVASRRLRLPVRLHGAAATLLGPLHARAADARRALPLLDDRLAIEILDRLDLDASQLVARPRLAPVVRTLVFDDLTRRFLDAHPSGTVVEVGAGLNTRFERLDNGRQRWVDVDVPEVTTLRRALLPPSRRRLHLAAFIQDPSWLEWISTTPPPYCFVIEAVLGYLDGDHVKGVLGRVARRFPGATIAFDLHPWWTLIEDVLVKQASAGVFAADLPRAIERWGLGLRLVETTRFLGSTPRRPGALVLSATRACATAPHVVARYVADAPATLPVPSS